MNLNNKQEVKKGKHSPYGVCLETRSSNRGRKLVGSMPVSVDNQLPAEVIEDAK